MTDQGKSFTEIGIEVANILLDIEAIHVKPDTPFTLTSGRKSPVYIDCRKIISFPRARRRINQLMAQQICQSAGYEAFDAVAGGETAGIPYAAFLSEALDLPMLYVRKKPKGFGRNAQIEGHMPEGSRVLLVEDLATDGGSKVLFIDALRAAGAQTAHVSVVFHYDIFPESQKIMADAGCQLHALATWWDVLEVIKRRNSLDQAQLAKLVSFLQNPNEWQG